MIDRLMIVGPPKSDKSTLAKALAVCLARTGRHVDLRDQGEDLAPLINKGIDTTRRLLARMATDGLLH
jgi:hypothetical protein